MASKIVLKKSSVPSKVPQSNDLDYGELAINYADKKLYFKNSSNIISYINNQDTFNVVSIGGNSITASSPTDTLSIGSTGAITLIANTLTKTVTIGLDETQITSFVPKLGNSTITGNLEVTGDITAANLTLSSGEITFADNSVQLQRAPRFYTNSDFDENGNPIYPFIAGDHYYDNITDSLFVYTNFGTYYDFKDITVRV